MTARFARLDKASEGVPHGGHLRPHSSGALCSSKERTVLRDSYVLLEAAHTVCLCLQPLGLLREGAYACS